MATVTKRRGRYVLDYYDLHGKRRWVTMPEDATLKQSKEKLREIEDGLAKGIHLPVREAPGLKEVAEDWLKHKGANVRGSTLQQYEGHLKHFAKQDAETGFGIDHLKVNRITVKTIEEWMAARRKAGVTVPTMKKILMTLGAVLKYAVRHRYIMHNPLSDVERPRDRGHEKKAVFTVLKREEIERLIEAVEHPKFKMLVFLAVMSGARQGELFGLKWTDVLWQPGQIHIQRTFNHGHWFTPKTRTSIRKVDLGPKAMSALKRWRLACPPNELDLVFPDEDGKPLSQWYVTRHHFKPALEKAKLPKMRFHDLRHCCASLLIDQGETIVYIQKQLGHSKATTTLDIYSHLLEKHRPEAAAKMENGIEVAEW